MVELGSATYVVRFAGGELKKGLTAAQGQAEKAGKGITGAFSRVQKSIQSTAGRVPVIGGALAGLATPAGLATAGVGLVVGGLTKMVSKSLDLGRAMYPKVQIDQDKVTREG